MRALTFSAEGVQEYPAETVEALRTARAAPETTWVRATDATAEDIDRIAAAFDIHALTIEDVRQDVRPKTEVFGDYTFTLLKDAELRRGEQVFADEIADEPLGVFIGEGWLVTLSPGSVPAVDAIWTAVLEADSRILQRGPDFTAYRVIDRLVDEYFDVLDGIETDIEAIEEAVLESPEIETLEAINAVRRDLLAFRKMAWPSREAVTTLARGGPAQIQPETEKYFRDVADHLVQVVDLTETYRDLTAGARDIYLNNLSQSTNEVMKALTVVATIFIPLTFVVGIYGMNFDPASGPLSMPELGWPLAYPATLLGMGAIVVIMLWYFREREWL
ncbi:MAG: magnesium/cobalt transporter CorA [Salinirussus sp.]